MRVTKIVLQRKARSIKANGIQEMVFKTRLGSLNAEELIFKKISVK